MKRKTVVFALAAWMLLFGCFHVYGYWVERMEASCELSFAFPVQVEIQGMKEAEVMWNVVSPLDSPIETREGEQREHSELSAADDNGKEVRESSSEAQRAVNTKSESSIGTENSTGGESDGGAEGRSEQK